MVPGAAESDQPQWQAVVARKLDIQKDTIAPFLRLEAPPQADGITGIDDVEALAESIASRKCTAFDVALAYIQQAARAHEKVSIYCANQA